jgi:hypothetical protein
LRHGGLRGGGLGLGRQRRPVWRHIDGRSGLLHRSGCRNALSGRIPIVQSVAVTTAAACRNQQNPRQKKSGSYHNTCLFAQCRAGFPVYSASARVNYALFSATLQLIPTFRTRETRDRDLTQIKACILILRYEFQNTDSQEKTMLRLAGILYSLISTTVAGTAVIAALVSGYDTLIPIVVAAVAGFVLALPITYFVTKAIYAS